MPRSSSHASRTKVVSTVNVRNYTAGRIISPPESPPASILSPPTSPAEFLSSPYLAQLHPIIHIPLLALDRTQRNLVMVCIVQQFAGFLLRR